MPLFERGPRGVVLTDDGRLLCDAVRASLDMQRDATAALRARHAQRELTLITDVGFATYWLMPRLAELKRVMPNVDVRVVTSQDFNVQRDHADIAMLFGDGHWPSCTAAPLFREIVTPVCSPAFRDAHSHVAQPADLLSLQLLHVQPTQPERSLSWRNWFDTHGLPAPDRERGVTFNSYALVIHAALIGEGVALGWTPLVDELVTTGQLVKLVDAPVVTPRGYFLVRQPSRTEADAASVFSARAV